MTFQEFVKVCPNCGKGGHFHLIERGHFLHKEKNKCDLCDYVFHEPKEVRQLTNASTRDIKSDTHSKSTTTHKRGFLDNLLSPPPQHHHRHRKRGGWY